MAKGQEPNGVPEEFAKQILNLLCKVCLQCNFCILLIIKLLQEQKQADYT